jgi:hypothetical protein
VLREGWDGAPLRVLTKNSPCRVSEPFISVIGHVTGEELHRLLSHTDMFNGFANRFLWLLARRSKSLPDGHRLKLDPSAIDALRSAVEFARNVTLVERDERATGLWRSNYDALTQERFGPFGVVTSRASAHALRLSLLYAVLDSSAQVRVEHLRAALELWRYCEASARIVFGRSTGDRTTDRIREALREAGLKGLTRKSIQGLLGNHADVESIDRAKRMLVARGDIRVDMLPTRGRPAEQWVWIGGAT